MQKDIRFILVWAECPYVQFMVVARVISTERFIVGGTNERERDRSQVSDGKVERMPRAWLLLGCMLCLGLIHRLAYIKRSVPLVGCPALPLIDQGGAGITDGRKRKKQR